MHAASAAVIMLIPQHCAFVEKRVPMPPPPAADENDAPETVQRFASMYSKIQQMSVSEKVKLATMGNKEARSLLIKDANNLVVQAVLSSPKLGDDELVQYAGDKNLSKEVARSIASRRELTRQYRIKRALVHNPNTPVHATVGFLSSLQEKDLRQVARSKNIPTVVTTAARKLLEKRRR